MSCDNDQKRGNLPIRKCHVTKTKNGASVSNKLQLQNHSLIFIHRENNFFKLPAFFLVHIWLTTLLHRQLQLTCANNKDFGTGQDKFGQFLWSNNDSNY